MDARALNDKATALFTQGKFAKAAEAWASCCEADPRDLRARLRLGDARMKAGQRDEAVSAYVWAMEGFAKEGFLPRAIAAAKLVLEVDPGHPGVQRSLADLYARKSSKPVKAAPPPPSPRDHDEGLVIEVGGPITGEVEIPLAAHEEPLDDLEIDVDESSLLHAVEAAAVRGAVAHGRPGAAARDEIEALLEALEELPEEPGSLPHIPLFSDLPADAFMALFDRCPMRHLQPGERVLSQGTHGDAFFVVCEGAVRVVRADGDAVVELARLDEGAFFGEMALLSEAPRVASVEALEPDTQVLEIGAAVLKELSRDYPSVSAALINFCRERLLSNLMQTAELFRPFSVMDRRDLVQHFHAREVRRGAVLIHEGQRAEGLFVVLSGEVDVLVQGRRVSRLREGDVVGEISLLTRSPATATVVAARHTSLLHLPRADFDRIIMSHPQVLEHIAELTDERSRANAAAQLV
jgi:CRP-like cAMP-binding protein